MHQRSISRAEMGDTWPLTVEEGTLRYNPVMVADGEPVGPLTFIDHRGREFAVNGLAKDFGYPPIDSIWANESPSRKPLKSRHRSLAKLVGLQVKKKNIRPLIDLGLSLAQG